MCRGNKSQPKPHILYNNELKLDLNHYLTRDDCLGYIKNTQNLISGNQHKDKMKRHEEIFHQQKFRECNKHMKRCLNWSWCDGSVVKSMGCSSRGSEFDSQHLHLILSSGLHGHQELSWCNWRTFRQNIHTQKINKNNLFVGNFMYVYYVSW